MRRLNLLPKDPSKVVFKKIPSTLPLVKLGFPVKKAFAAAVVAMVVMSVVQVVPAWLAGRQASKLISQANEMQGELTKSADENALLQQQEEQIQKSTKGIKEHVDFLKTTMNSRLRFSRVLIALGGVAPDGLWVKSIDVSAKGMLVDGQASSYSLVSQMMFNMVKALYFHDPTLSFTRKKEDAKSDLIEYELFAPLVAERMLFKAHE